HDSQQRLLVQHPDRHPRPRLHHRRAGPVSRQHPLTVTFTESSLEVTQGTSPWVVSGTVCATQCTTPWVVNVADWNGVAVGSPTAWGTAPTGNVVGTNSELFAGNTALTATGTSLNVNLTGGT